MLINCIEFERPFNQPFTHVEHERAFSVVAEKSSSTGLRKGSKHSVVTISLFASISSGR